MASVVGPQLFHAWCSWRRPDNVTLTGGVGVGVGEDVEVAGGGVGVGVTAGVGV